MQTESYHQMEPARDQEIGVDCSVLEICAQAVKPRGVIATAPLRR